LSVREPGVGLYVHFPYCAVRCTYCDFNTYLTDAIPGAAYYDAVAAEAERRTPDFADWPLRTIYFGGGTPSLWGAEYVGRLIQAAARWFPKRRTGIEITLECNPGEATPELLAAYRDVGVTRLSLGVQSLDDTILGRLARRHTAREALDGLENALATGFTSVSADLMFALPGQDLNRWSTDLAALAQRGVPHLSLYQLTLEPGTAMTREVNAGRLQLPDEDVQAAMWDAVDDVAERYDMPRYEISNLAIRGHESQHNSAYWLGFPYLGLGAGAHSFRPPQTWSPDSVAVRSSNRKHHTTYSKQSSAGESVTVFSEDIDRTTHLRERMFTGLRHLRGLNLETMAHELGVDPAVEFEQALAWLQEQNLVTVDGSVARLTSRGVRMADSVSEKFF
jgi:oxygen-independent coproporphyrinogen-3 oxidase